MSKDDIKWPRQADAVLKAFMKKTLKEFGKQFPEEESSDEGEEVSGNESSGDEGGKKSTPLPHQLCFAACVELSVPAGRTKSSSNLEDAVFNAFKRGGQPQWEVVNIESCLEKRGLAGIYPVEASSGWYRLNWACFTCVC